MQASSGQNAGLSGAASGRGRRKIGDVDVEYLRQYAEIAALSMRPAEMSQRAAVKELLPNIYVLRHHGYGWAQIAQLFAEGGFSLQPSTWRQYFAEMIVGRMDECEKRLRDSIVVLAEAEKITKGSRVSDMAGKVAANIQRQESRTNARLEATFGEGGSGPSSPSPLAGGVVGADAGWGKAVLDAGGPGGPATAAPPARRAGGAEAGVAPPPGGAPSPASGAAGEGKNARRGAARGEPHREKAEEREPSASSGGSVAEGPATSAAAPAAAGAAAGGGLRCLPLQPGVKPLKPNPKLPPEALEDGLMEHPAIPGLMLGRAERLYGAFLEIEDDKGQRRLEKVPEKSCRIFWRVPIPETIGSTSHHFVDLDPSLGG